jgi:hypothetical protein
MKDGFQIGVSGADDGCDYITVSGRKADWNMRAMKEPDERACAERFCTREHPELTDLTKMPWNSPVDVRAESTDKKSRLDFQVTTLWPVEFWRSFGKGPIDRRVFLAELTSFIRACVQRKIEKQSSSHDVILLIDTKPADLPPQCLEKIRSDEQLTKGMAALGNFLQIWLVDSNGTVRLK